MDTIRLDRPDRDFTKAVEHESGQNLLRCYQCGNCTAGCPMSFEYDYSVSRVMRLIQAGQKDIVLSSRAIWMCTTCETCTQRCPNNIDVAKVMDTCRQMARQAGKRGVYSFRSFVDSFMTSVKWTGRMHEISTMAMYMLRTGKFWTDLDLIPNTVPKGKMPPLPHMVKGRKEVLELMNRFKAGVGREIPMSAVQTTPPRDIDETVTGPVGVIKDDPCNVGGTPRGMDAGGLPLASPSAEQAGKNQNGVKP